MSKEETYIGKHYKTGKTIRIVVQNDKIQSVENIPENKDALWIAPGLVDLQVNGFMGINLNDFHLTIDNIEKISVEMGRFGVTTFYPTLITNDISILKNHLSLIAEVYNNPKNIYTNIGGIHLEGPFISPEQGPRGAHPLKFILPPDWKLFESLQKAAKGLIKIITISPEYEESISFIEKCVASGVVVAIGHTAATPEQIKNAVNAGASLSTHLGNGSHMLLHRHHNYIWQQLAEDDLWASIIADGFHLPENLLKLFFKLKSNKVFLVSDTTNFAGLPPGIYSSTIGNEVVLDSSGKLSMKSNTECLAGSAKSLLENIQFITQKKLKVFHEAWDLGSTAPMKFLKTEKIGLVTGAYADFVLLDKNNQNITIHKTIKKGKIIYSNSL